MQHIITPTTETIQETATTGSFAIEPLNPGYGATLGNALRRVLLSSLVGAAVDAVEIDGVEHEFSTISGVREDVVEILMNLKAVRFRLEGEAEFATLKLSAKGAGVVTAKSLTGDNVCVVVSPDAPIATLSDGGKLEMTVHIRRGAGYLPVERKLDREKRVGLIVTDSIFSPVTSVAYHVENTRVGQMTNYDRLVLDITTDGSIAPQLALQEAAAMLVAQYQAVAGSVIPRSTQPPAEAMEDEIPTPMATAEVALEDGVEMLHGIDAKTKIEDSGLSPRTVRALAAAGYKTLAGIKRLSDLKLQSIEGIGDKGLTEIKAVLDRVS